MSKRILLATLIVVAALGWVNLLQGSDRAPETGITLIYNSSTTAGTANRAVLVLDFGGDKTSTAGDFTIQFPTADASNAIIRIA